MKGQEKQSTANTTAYDVELVINNENTKAFWKPLFTSIQKLIQSLMPYRVSF